MIQGGEEEEKGGKGGVGPLGVGEGLSSLGVWLACRRVDVSARLQLGMLACQHGGVGAAACWFVGTLVRWFVGALALWCAGTLPCWHVSVGLVQWHTGERVHCHAGVWAHTSGGGSARVYTL